ncbi:hypothetical protein V6N13_015717 [Hibiscus sabdariffa]|uniref:Uncharacterized protein n=1 Tax=Hibiscus sabdariffa TaxID=183260 RepID=A0ABR2CWH7_9ROSI
MVKDVRYMQELGEVAPPLVITHCSPKICPRLDSIPEEEVGDVEALKMFFVLPVLLSLSVYVFLHGQRTNMWLKLGNMI